jgi:hypothetical protein
LIILIIFGEEYKLRSSSLCYQFQYTFTELMVKHCASWRRVCLMTVIPTHMYHLSYQSSW